jgi:uncharacterized protein
MKQAVKIKSLAYDREIDGLLYVPENSVGLFAFAHGAGAGMHHSFMETVARGLFDRQIGTFRYMFPYMAQGKKRPDPQKHLLDTVASVAAHCLREFPNLTTVLGGKSMGGRMSSLFLAQDLKDEGSTVSKIPGIVFLGFPLHPPKKPSADRAAHLDHLEQKMLFIQGTRDALAPVASIEMVVSGLSKAEIVVIEGADHSFAVLKRSPFTLDQVMSRLADEVQRFILNLK